MADRLDLDDPVATVPGVASRRATTLRSQFGIETVRDLIEHYPRRYEDLGELVPLDLATVGEPVTLVGTVVQWTQRQPTSKRTGRRLTISEATVRDGTGTPFAVTFFNQDWRPRRHPPGTVATFSGTLERRHGQPQLVMPDVHDLGRDGRTGDVHHRRLVPVYPATEAVPSWRMQGWIDAALDRLPEVDDFLPDDLRDQLGLMPLDTAVRAIHSPPDHRAAAAARRRIVFDELFTLQVGLHWRRVRLEAGRAGMDNGPTPDGRASRFLDALGFTPTAAQQRATCEVGADLAADRPMHRLLQGDVGSGKTLVATWTMLCAVDNGRQAVLMAPTEVLAVQHQRTLTDQLAPLGVNVLDGIRLELLTSATPTAAKRRILAELLSGTTDIVVGTHALLEEGVRFADLGVVVIDEQHRFGVHQRVSLREKATDHAAAPDVLVMTATPIPRSLALTLFGDLDVTVLDELPPGRQEVVTQVITSDQTGRRERLYAFVREQAARGRQTYVVCPLVEGSEDVAARAAEDEYIRLRDTVFADLRVGLVHGRMRGDDKDAAMSAFRRGELDVLVATTVVEVGVDVPSATVMIVEDADRFGISQLHQLRGRIGRGADRSYCVLFAGRPGEELTDEARTRLEAVALTHDGFALAEVDLELRGEGQLFGSRQSGMPDLKLARLADDLEVVVHCRQLAGELVTADPDLAAPRLAGLRAEVRRRYRGGLEQLEALATG
ncbi:MAG: ATP-dependent DNA helicase RecG [Actinobacteria bacterium]|nr:ATP-dependent DNA helicase RecG [Actinomycetota bacterium]